MQHGTQSRSSSGVVRAIGMLREGVIGEVLVAKHVNSQKRRDIGHEKPSRPPEHLDYDLWVGPAEWADYQANYVHYHWHWFYNFGTGDIGNDGVHGIDLARWGLGVETHPNLATGYGSKLYFDDDQEFPDTYTVTFVYPGGGDRQERLLVYEQRIWSPYRNDAQENSLYFYGTEGMMTLGGQGIRIYGKKNELIRQEEPYKLTKGVHQKDFLDAIRSGGRPVADIEVGHPLLHAPPSGEHRGPDESKHPLRPGSGADRGDDEANELLARRYRSGHWAVPS